MHRGSLGSLEPWREMITGYGRVSVPITPQVSDAYTRPQISPVHFSRRSIPSFYNPTAAPRPKIMGCSNPTAHQSLYGSLESAVAKDFSDFEGLLVEQVGSSKATPNCLVTGSMVGLEVEGVRPADNMLSNLVSDCSGLNPCSSISCYSCVDRDRAFETVLR
ncbi:hypothetical protein K504DRAFT_152056 [Pleomassaria siparia CBS 279.74]|uniref:Uncharacterized protein n=1 Tax=Pleomassaria siparia CBS 279.74 TaxID=1314801 RepID=A0A6G1KND7_9PLEO|nr:hypothetical protein K504DRAFT_152056 [Pleomassaria siparia CBS 279.74]